MFSQSQPNVVSSGNDITTIEWENLLIGLHHLRDALSSDGKKIVDEEILGKYTVSMKGRRALLQSMLEKTLQSNSVSRYDMLILHGFLKNFPFCEAMLSHLTDTLNTFSFIENSLLEAITAADALLKASSNNSRELDGVASQISNLLQNEISTNLGKDILSLSAVYLEKIGSALASKSCDFSIKMLKLKCFKYLNPSKKYGRDQALNNKIMNRLSTQVGNPTTVQHIMMHSEQRVILLEELGNADAFSSVLHHIVSFDLESIIRENNAVGTVADATFATFGLLKPKLQKEFSICHYSILCDLSPVFTPNFIDGTNLSNEILIQHVKLFCSLYLYSNQCERISRYNLLSVHHGWEWINRAVHQLYFLSSNFTQTKISFSYDVACSCVQLFLENCGDILYSNYQYEYGALLQKLLEIVIPKAQSGPALRLVKFIDQSSQEGKRSMIRKMSSTLIESAIIESWLGKFNDEMKRSEADKSSGFMIRVKQLGIDRLRVVFNKLSTTKESQVTAVSNLLQHIRVASGESPDMLKYVLYKIVAQIFKECQEEFFCEMDQGHPLKLARVVCGLCKNIGDLKMLITQHFYHLCPILIPSVDGQEVSQEKLAKTVKVICVFCVICMQPQQTPFTLADLWKWLARLTNLCVSRKVKAYYVPTIFEVALRVTAPTLFKAFGVEFMQMVGVIQSEVLPNFDSTVVKYGALEEFLKRYISSNGKDHMGFFTTNENLNL